jgi:DNA replication protein DnaC
VAELEKAQAWYMLDRLPVQLERVPLLICDELGYVSLNRGGLELLFQVFADRYERGSLLITTKLPFGEWNQIFQGEWMTAALLDLGCSMFLGPRQIGVRLTNYTYISKLRQKSP